jgi:hypothetical protein
MINMAVIDSITQDNFGSVFANHFYDFQLVFFCQKSHLISRFSRATPKIAAAVVAS